MRHLLVSHDKMPDETIRRVVGLMQSQQNLRVTRYKFPEILLLPAYGLESLSAGMQEEDILQAARKIDGRLESTNARYVVFNFMTGGGVPLRTLETAMLYTVSRPDAALLVKPDTPVNTLVQEFCTQSLYRQPPVFTSVAAYLEHHKRRQPVLA